ncbi:MULTISPECIES: multicopper oxidase domain-containing protein [Moorena]|uniref:Putative multicopper oxidase n=1 Tax=Moorena producens 3L TaxID=489825 RepID=F4XVS8_9CYAN|nr:MULTISPECIES: multicopper oxidase domain-containing protein [Moorena]EGJ31341.1 putative multicopper oxidase [Moorena producens 3L]NEP66295.1 multicopper oxidase domain-containing protein [Moorena sp. SIO3A5]OLT66973.1 hypothetical protein BI334_19935 [Moorena producens 3L]
MAVSTFTGKAVAEAEDVVDLVDSCSVITSDYLNEVSQPDFKNPPFAYTNDTDTQYPRQGVTLNAVQDELYLDVDRTRLNGYKYDGYLYKTTFYDKDGNRKTIVRDTGKPAQIEIADYNPTSPPGNMVGTYNPPTIVTSPGEFVQSGTFDNSNVTLNSFDLELTNNLPVRVPLAGSLPQTKENLENQSQYTNLHYHGFNVSPLLGSDDVLVDVHSNITPGSTEGGYYPGDNPQEPQYGGPISEYKMTVKMPVVHQSGLFWYHSHAHSMSQQQVQGGLSGGIIIKGMDDYYNFLNLGNPQGLIGVVITPDNEPEDFTVNQKVMMFKDFNNVLNGNNPKCFTLNGQVNPKITIRPGEVQLWRIANSGSNQYMNIALEKGTRQWQDGHYVLETPSFAEPNGEANFIVLARDGDVVEKPFQTNSVLLPPAARVELLVVGGEVSSEYYLVSDFSTNLTEGQKWAGGKSQLLATVEVEGDKVCYDNLNLSSVVCTGGSDLYTYLQGPPNYQDKILPPSEAIMADTLENCPDKYDHYAYRIDENGNKIVYDSQVPYDGKENDGKKRCITPPADMYRDPLTKKRYFYFSREGGSKYFLKGFETEAEAHVDGEISQAIDTNKIKELFDGIRIDKISRTGDLEEWHLVNADTLAHVFHIHQLDFVVTKVTLAQDLTADAFNGKYNNYDVESCQEAKDPLPNGEPGKEYKLKPQGYRDVINLPANSVTTVRIPFVNPFITGVFVYHCHILGHEDRGMMNNIKVVNPDGYEKAGIMPTVDKQ